MFNRQYSFKHSFKLSFQLGLKISLLALSLEVATLSFAADFETTDFRAIKALAEQYDAQAQYRLGFKYYIGKGVQQNYIKAFEWYLKAANQGHFEAQNNLGELYEYGKGVEQDSAKAFIWYLKAAEQGDALAQSNVGTLYHRGHGVEKDYAKAIEWYLKSASQGNKGAERNLRVLYETIQSPEKQYAKDATENQSINQTLRSAIQGDPAAQYSMAMKYSNGSNGVIQDNAKAFYWFKRAADQGHAKLKLIRLRGMTKTRALPRMKQ